MKKTNKRSILVLINVIFIILIVFIGSRYYQAIIVMNSLHDNPTIQHYYSEFGKFSFDVPLHYQISDSVNDITIDQRNNVSGLSISIKDGYTNETRDIIDNREFYSGFPVDVTVDSYTGFDRYVYQSGPRKGEHYYLKPLGDYLFASIFGTSSQYKNDMDFIAKHFQYYPDEK